MINLGTVRPGSTIRIPFSSFDKDDGSSITMTNFAVGDILVYKDGSTTERASTAGFTATTDFDSKTGKHLAIIDLADNTTSGFWNAGSEYLVAIDAVTIDAVTTGGWIARFTIGYVGAMIDTTIATLSSQTSFTLTAGPAEDNALTGMWAIIHDIASAVQCAKVLISAYTGSTKTVTLAAGATFTASAGDNISVMELAPLQPATTGRTLVVDSAGLADANTVKVGPTGSGTAQTARDIGASVLLSAGTGTGQLDFTSGVVKANITQFNGVAGTFASGRPEVNTSHIAGSAVSTSSAQIGVNVVNAAGTAWNSGAIGAATLATDTITAAKIAADAIGASELAADAVTEIQSGLATSSALSTLQTDVTTLLGRITSTLFSGITSLAQWLGLLAGKQTGNSTARTELRATGAGSGTFDETTDSQEALRDRGDAAWITATGFSTLDAAGVRSAVGLASANLDTQLSAIDDYIDTEVGAIKTKTDQLQFASGYVLSDLRAISAAPVAVDTGTAGTISFLSGEYVATQGGTVSANIVQIDGENVVSDGAGKLIVDVSEYYNSDTDAYENLPLWQIDAVTDRLGTMIESTSDGDVFTAAALQQAPSGSGASAADIADAVWEEAIADHSGTSGSTAEALAAAGAAGDPWITALPGSYSSGQAGYIIGNNLNATVSSRAASSVLGAPAGASIAADIAAVKADTAATLTDTAEIGTAGAGLTALASAANLATLTGYVDTEVAAIKAKTDNLPAAPAAVGDIPTATQNADALLKRDWTSVTGEAARSTLNALRFLRNKWTLTGTTLSVKEEDDSTEAWTAEVSTTPGADPITGSDPA